MTDTSSDASALIGSCRFVCLGHASSVFATCLLPISFVRPHAHHTPRPTILDHGHLFAQGRYYIRKHYHAHRSGQHTDCPLVARPHTTVSTSRYAHPLASIKELVRTLVTAVVCLLTMTNSFSIPNTSYLSIPHILFPLM